jgi:hypothetical protein
LIKAGVKTDVGVMWSEAMEQIQTKLQNAMIVSQELIEKSYTAANQCEHGCKCKFIEDQYKELNRQIEAKNQEIAGHEAAIDVQMGLIEGYEVDPCDFTEIQEEYLDLWADMEEENAAAIAALADWKNDGYEMENVVDQEAFAKAYGFEYESSRFDDYL